MTAPRAQIDVIRLDNLLWALGGFAELPAEHESTHRLPDPLWDRIEELAALPRTPQGALVRLAATWGRPVNTMRVLVHRVRRGRYPAYRRSA